MSPAVGLIVIIFLAAGTAFGWHAHRARAAHQDVQTTKKNRLPNYRRTRQRSGTIAVVLAVIIVLVGYALLRA
jgi:ABC-type Fe3+ transport system permease subunit